MGVVHTTGLCDSLPADDERDIDDLLVKAGLLVPIVCTMAVTVIGSEDDVGVLFILVPESDSWNMLRMTCHSSALLLVVQNLIILKKYHKRLSSWTPHIRFPKKHVFEDPENRVLEKRGEIGILGLGFFLLKILDNAF